MQTFNGNPSIKMMISDLNRPLHDLVECRGTRADGDDAGWLDSIGRCTAALTSGDLAGADRYAGYALAQAVTTDQRMVVEVLACLLGGLAALAMGHPQATAHCWSRIRDAHFHVEVAHAASRMGMDVPDYHNPPLN